MYKSPTLKKMYTNAIISMMKYMNENHYKRLHLVFKYDVWNYPDVMLFDYRWGPGNAIYKEDLPYDRV